MVEQITPAALELCIVMPAYNEEGCIEDVIKSWFSVVDRLSLKARLVVVNDGSKDKTGVLLDALATREPRLVVKHQTNAGHGKALLHAYRVGLEQKSEWIFHVDSDDQFEVNDFDLLWNRRKESRFILGLRKARKDALHRLVITRIVRLVNAVLFGRYIPDANIPFRLIRASYLEELLKRLPEEAFAPNIFLSILAARDGEKLLNIPVTHRDRRTGTVSIVKWKLIKVCFRCVGELLKFRV
jgi:dolichol-phosphate mannosyltransferase